MSNQQILEKAIKRAIDGGWINPRPSQAYWSSAQLGNWLLDLTDQYKIVIFNHDFAKALWDYPGSWKKHSHGRVVTYHERAGSSPVPAVSFVLPIWQYHLQNMVIAEDPIAYLGANI